MLYHLTSSISCDSRFAATRRGLENWKAIFNQRCVNNDEYFFDVQIVQPFRTENVNNDRQYQLGLIDEPSLWKRLGFWKHAPEFWLLATLRLAELQFGSPASGPVGDVSSLENASLEKIRRFVERFRAGKFGS